jgi:3-oxoacyl-[acyl-carrier-protein] synthase II
VKRVVVTGMGVMSPCGNDPATFFENLVAARSGIGRHSKVFPSDGTPWLTGEVPPFSTEGFTKMRLGTLDRTTLIALLTARQAVASANLVATNKNRAGVYWGTGLGGASTMEESYRQAIGNGNGAAARVKPTTVVMTMNNAATSEISLDTGFTGPTYTYSIACASSAIGIGEALRAIRNGYCDCAIAGGADSLLTLGSLKAWQALQTLAREDAANPGSSCRPFAADRSGFVLGEGAGAVVLEEAESAIARGATIYAELAGFGSTSDASHITKPSVEGQTRAMHMAMDDAGLKPHDIGYINAHGTATAAGDLVETNAIKATFGAAAMQVPVSSTKALHGHLMGATGVVEFIAALMALRENVIPPTAHLHKPDPACDLDYVPNVARREVNLRAVMSNSFAFGGNNAVLIAKKFS